jgi:hypothetical protein
MNKKYKFFMYIYILVRKFQFLNNPFKFSWKCNKFTIGLANYSDLTNTYRERFELFRVDEKLVDQCDSDLKHQISDKSSGRMWNFLNTVVL